MSTFVDRLAAASESTHSLVCVGLDPDPALMAVPDVVDFNQSIVDATSDLVCAYKPNLAFYEAQGPRGFEALAKTISHIQSVAPTAIIIGDAKRGDVSSTNVAYARALFDVWGFDAATINGYAGGESLEPFFDYENKGVFVWCRSSNPGAKEFQDLSISRGPARGADGIPLYQCMAERAAGWNSRGNVGLVVGSTYPDELGAVPGPLPRDADSGTRRRDPRWRTGLIRQTWAGFKSAQRAHQLVPRHHLRVRRQEGLRRSCPQCS